MVAREAAGQDRRVVRERHRGQPRHRPVRVRGAHVEQARHVRRFAGGGHVVEHVGVGAVAQEPDDVRRRPPARSRTSSRTSPSWPWTYDPSSAGARPSSSATVGATSTRPGPRHQPVGAHPFPATMKGACACTTSSDPCSPRCPPWSSQLWAAEWITHRSGAAGWSKSWATCSYPNGYELSRLRVGVGALGVQAGEPVRRLIGEGIGALARDLLVPARPRSAGSGPTRRASGPRTPYRGEQDHVDDGIEGRVEQDLERALGVVLAVGGDLVEEAPRSAATDRHAPVGGYRRSDPIVSAGPG